MKRLTTKQAYQKASELDNKKPFHYIGINGMHYSLFVNSTKKGYSIKRFDRSGL